MPARDVLSPRQAPAERVHRGLDVASRRGDAYAGARLRAHVDLRGRRAVHVPDLPGDAARDRTGAAGSAHGLDDLFPRPLAACRVLRAAQRAAHVVGLFARLHRQPAPPALAARSPLGCSRRAVQPDRGQGGRLRVRETAGGLRVVSHAGNPACEPERQFRRPVTQEEEEEAEAPGDAIGAPRDPAFKADAPVRAVVALLSPAFFLAERITSRSALAQNNSAQVGWPD